MASYLPDPTFGNASSACLRCAYPLEGMPEHGRCPECGLPFHAASDTLVLHGVPRRQEVVPWRRAAWILLAVLMVFFTQGIVLLLMYQPIYAGVAALALIAAVIGMIVTGTSGKRGTQQFVITPSGLSRSDPKGKHPPTFILWDAPVYTELRKISPVWRRLRLTTMPTGRGEIHLDAGIRCREEDLHEVTRILDALSSPESGHPLSPIQDHDPIGPKDPP